MMIHCIRTLTTSDLPKYRDHLLRLDAEDRRLRFGYPISDQAIRDHVRRIDTKADRILVQVDENLNVIAAVHIAAGRPGTVEFAFSVDRDWRGRGLGRQLFEQAIMWARNRGLRDAFIYYLVDNRAMRRLARQAGMTSHNEAGEIEGQLRLQPPTPLSYLRELASEPGGCTIIRLRPAVAALGSCCRNRRSEYDRKAPENDLACNAARRRLLPMQRDHNRAP